MERCRKVACALITAALSFFDLGLRAGLEYRWPAGPGFGVAVGTSLIMDFVGNANITGEALAILPLFRLGRSGALDLALGVPSLMYVGELINSSLIFSVGGTARLRFALGSRWSLSVRAGGGYPFALDSTGLHAGAIDPTLWLWPDLQIGALFRL